MKSIVKVLALSVAAVALFACAKESPINDEPIKNNVKVVQFTTTPITKTVFGTPSGSTLPTLWTSNHAVALSLNLASTKKSTDPVIANGGETANFEASIDDDNSGDYNFYAISPYDALVGVNSGYKSINVSFPAAQTPSATSPDELAQILYGEYAAGSSFPTSVTMDFKHLSAYGKISFSNLSLAVGEAIASVSLTAAENWAGRFYYYADDHDTYSKGDFAANSASKTITIHTNSETDIWFGCAPVDLGGKTIDVVITTDKATTYRKQITIPTGKSFTSGKVNAFTINMSGITKDEADVYTLVESVADLTVGSKVIIVAADSDVAMSTTQNNNNRAQAAITKSGKTISSPGADVQIFTLQNGNKSGTWAFYTGSGYIFAAASGSNYLRTEQSLSDNSSWEISITGGTASIVAQGTNTRNTLQYNNGSSLFSCYASASQGAVAIYKKGSGGSTPSPTTYSVTISSTTNGTITASPNTNLAEGDEVTLTINPSTGYQLASLIVDETSVDIATITGNTYTFDMPAHDVTVSATFTSTSGGGSTPTLQYTLTPASGSNNSYAGNCDIDIDNITWNLTGNSQQIPWRIGGKSLSGVDRALYSKTALAKNISKIEITHGAASSITVNSMTVIVSKNADFSSPVSTLTPSFVANGPVTVDRPDGKDWSNCYYKIVYNVTVSGSSNKFVEFSKAKFYGTN